MGQLSGRLRELARLYGRDERAWQPRLDAVADLERVDPERAHALFLEVRQALVVGRFRELNEALGGRSWLVDPPDKDSSGLTERELDRAIRDLEEALRSVRGVENALAEAREAHAHLRARAADVDFSPFSAVSYAGLSSAAAEAEALRRRVAQEAHVEARYRQACARAARLKLARVDLPDLSSAAEPDADAANAILAGKEAQLKDAERVEEMHALVGRSLRDAAVRTFTSERRKRILRRADDAASLPDRAAAASVLEALLVEAEALREDAAGASSRAARARKRGGRGPEPERRKGDLQDYYG